MANQQLVPLLILIIIFRLDKAVKDVHIIDAHEELVQEKRVIVLA